MKKTKPEPLARATMRLPESLWKKARHSAIDHGISLQELVSRAIAEYLERHHVANVKVQIKNTNYKIKSIAYVVPNKEKGNRS